MYQINTAGSAVTTTWQTFVLLR